jgi:hypothetical protein
VDGEEISMAQIVIERDSLVVRLSWLERLFAFRGDLRVPLARVRDVIVPPTAHGQFSRIDWRLIRMPGTSIPGVIQAGSYYRLGDGWEFYVVRRPSRCMVIELEGDRFRRLIVQVDGEAPEAAATRLLAARDSQHHAGPNAA